MLFNSIDFLIFFPLAVILYYVIPNKMSNVYLLTISYLFYMCWNPKYIFLILFCTIMSYFSGKIVGKARDNAKIKKIVILIIGIGLNLSVLVLFKYINLIIDTINIFMKIFKVSTSINIVNNIVLPVGISFYTFQAIGYIVDVYRGTVTPERDFVKYALYIAFFPQLVAGPIERSKDLLAQLSVRHKYSKIRTQKGILLMLWGYFLKMVIADRIAIYVDTVWAEYTKYQGFYILIAVVLFAFQIYCDFYGYSIIAVGSACILGIDLTDNFKSPYLSDSVAGFWRKWHISLTSWFKDYVYVPLGGNRKGKLCGYANKMIVFILSGLWHGASYSFLVWGGINGIYQIIENICYVLKSKILPASKIKSSGLRGYKVIKTITVFVLVDFAWIFFRSDGLKEAWNIIKAMKGTNNFSILYDGSLYLCGLDKENFYLLWLCLLVLLIADLCKSRSIIISDIIMRYNYAVKFIVIFVSTVFIMIFGIWGPAFSKSNFIYFQF